LAAAVARPSDARPPDLIKAVDVSLDQATDDLVKGRYVVKVTCARACTVSQGLTTSRSDAKRLGLPVPSLKGFPPRLQRQLIAAGARIGAGTTHVPANTPTVLHYRLDAKAKAAIAQADFPIHIGGLLKVSDKYGALFTEWKRTCRLPR
jgi:hypothetical protein